jgi:hypothetical protein
MYLLLDGTTTVEISISYLPYLHVSHKNKVAAMKMLIYIGS